MRFDDTYRRQYVFFFYISKVIIHYTHSIQFNVIKYVLYQVFPRQIRIKACINKHIMNKYKDILDI